MFYKNTMICVVLKYQPHPIIRVGEEKNNS